jgi:hypothetical protein
MDAECGKSPASASRFYCGFAAPFFRIALDDRLDLGPCMNVQAGAFIRASLALIPGGR